MDENKEPYIEWIPKGTRAMCIENVILKATEQVIYTEREIYTIEDNNVMITDCGLRITFRNTPDLFAEFFIKLS